MKIKCGGLLFTADFDSANLHKVEYVAPANEVEMVPCSSTCDSPLEHVSNFPCTRQQKSRCKTPVSSPLHLKKPYLKKRAACSSTKCVSSVDCKQNQPFLEFKVWTKPDCSGTAYETSFRTWFHFGVQGGPPGAVIKINVMNLNRQGKLYFHGMKPVFKTVPSKEGWKRISGKVDFKCENEGNFIISFCHTLPYEVGPVTYFAFTYPFSYSECQSMLDEIDKKIGTSLYLSKINKPMENAVYYSRELLCYSSDGNRVELLTVTSCKGFTAEREKRLSNLFPQHSKPRCHIFQNKKVVFISSRVHPGETPSSFVFNGILHYLLCSKDSIANRLRNLFVFKFIPMLNPDGVLHGHYRADLQGLNLNRIYMIANIEQHPSIYAARTLLLHYHSLYSSPIASTSFKTSSKKSRGSQGSDNVSLGRLQKKNFVTPNSKKLSKDTLTPVQKKAGIRKHFLHINENLTKKHDILLPFTTKTATCFNDISAVREKGNSPKKQKKIADVPAHSDTGLKLLVDKTKPQDINTDCSEFKDSSFLSKKMTSHDSDLPCSCVEGSDAEDCVTLDREAKLGEGDASKLLKDIPCLKPEESGIAYYFDLHGHASKRGCFIYGNYFTDVDKMASYALLWEFFRQQ